MEDTTMATLEYGVLDRHIVRSDWQPREAANSSWLKRVASATRQPNHFVLPYPKDRTIPSNYHALLQAIEESRWILELEVDWDDKGSPGYSEATWSCAVGFLTRSARNLWEYSGICMDIPNIDPGPSGSIDLHWKTASYELLLNVPSDTNTPVRYYGDNYGVRTAKGSLDVSEPNYQLLTWLMS